MEHKLILDFDWLEYELEQEELIEDWHGERIISYDEILKNWENENE